MRSAFPSLCCLHSHPPSALRPSPLLPSGAFVPRGEISHSLSSNILWSLSHKSPSRVTRLLIKIRIFTESPPTHLIIKPITVHLKATNWLIQRMANWEHQLREMFAQQDKDMSGFIGREDLICMLLNANKHDHVDPVFKTHLHFLIGVLKNADLNGDTKINFQEFKQYIAQAVDESQGVPIPVEHLQPEMDKKDLVNGQ